MSVGGRIISHQKYYLGDERSTILFVGYQAAGSLGRRIANGEKKVIIDNVPVTIRAGIVQIDGFSAHKDSDHLLEFVSHSAKTLKKVFVCMGEPSSETFLAQKIRDNLGVTAMSFTRGGKQCRPRIMSTDKKFIPKVSFVPALVDKEADLFCSFLSDGKGGRWSHVFRKIYPELETVFNESKDKDEFKAKIREFTEKTTEKNKPALLKAQNLISKDWETISNEFLTTLSEHFETDWPLGKETIIGYVSILPVFPRFLDRYSFCGFSRSFADKRNVGT